MREDDRRLRRAVVAGPLGRGERCPDLARGHRCPGLDQAQLPFEPGRNLPAGSRPGHGLRSHVVASLGQRAVRGCQAGDRLDQFVRAGLEGGIELLEPTARLLQLMVFQVHPGQCHKCCGVRRAGQAAAARRPRRRLSPARPASRRGATGRARPRPARDGRGRRPVRAHSPVWLRRRRPNRGRGPPHRGGPTTAPRPRERTARGPGLPGIGRACLRQAWPARASARVAACRRRGEVPAAARYGEADHRGGEPGRGLVVGGKPLEDVLGRVQPGDGRLKPASRQRDRGGRPGAAAVRARLRRAACRRAHRPATGHPSAR